MVGATNHVGLLDHALFRRFDAVFEYDLPSSEIATKVMQTRLALLDIRDVDWARATTAAEGLSHAEITRACEQTAKDALLAETTVLHTDGLVTALSERRRTRL
jgi:SpoVK/Ycf46/Vps4 family AAA+-type ATPase